MASRRHLDDWIHALKDLESRPSEFEGMERVLSVLEFSYEALPNEIHKKCFLYCSIFPEDHKFQMDELIDLCIGEGFLNECDTIHETCHRGINIISSLGCACLLEEDSSGSTRRFRMHNVIRDMALWLASNRGQKKKNILVQKKCRSFDTKKLKKWNTAERISLWDVDQNIENFPARMSCSNLSTLILRNTKWTSITKLPLELKNLIKLVFLLVDRTSRIPKGVILSLSSLKVFHWGSPILSTGCIDEGDECNVIEELPSTSEIDEAHLTLSYAGTVTKLLMDCPHLQRCLGELRIAECEEWEPLIIPKSSLRIMEHLNHLSVYRCAYDEISICSTEYGSSETGSSDGSLLAHDYIPGPTSSEESQDCFRNLKKIDIKGCPFLRDMSLLIYHAPNLANLTIEDCPAMQELIGWKVGFCVEGIFSCIIELHLTNLPEFESICWLELPFPLLERLEVKKCPKLERLPLNRGSAWGRSLAIVGEQRWWNRLHWDEQQDKKFFSTKFNGLDEPFDFMKMARDMDRAVELLRSHRSAGRIALL
ncbi:disease resistance protein SUMM2-like isoform X2 [Punica granatum]|uniref:Disease resistance protein SUMM2-like isoform X2 n=1 Tax=Punica granatum TaxID=22663 RepID=A0A6P8BP27_PUNGR|nr:disease resistance protein SUMM2-like isoform X2 [Punica granatum]